MFSTENLCLNLLDLNLRESDCWKQRWTGHCRVLNFDFPDERYGLSEKATDYIVSENMFLPGLRMLIPEGVHWNGEVLQDQRYIHIFMNGSKLGRSTGTGVSVGNSVLNFTSG